MKRKDTWSAEHDFQLAQTVLEYVKTNKSQLEAFEHAANKLNRTSAACGFRWNVEVRKRYEAEIQQAKLDRANNKTKSGSSRKRSSAVAVVEAVQPSAQEVEDSFDALGKAFEAAETAYRQLQSDYEKLQRTNAKIEKKMEEQLNSGDLNALVQLMDRARELGIIKGESPAV
jgi:prespore-specific regulator